MTSAVMTIFGGKFIQNSSEITYGPLNLLKSVVTTKYCLKKLKIKVKTKSKKTQDLVHRMKKKT